MAKQLNNYILAGQVEPAKQILPNISLKAEPPATVKVGQTFEVELLDSSGLVPECYGMSDTPRVVIAEGVMSEGGKFAFYANDKGVTELSIFLARGDTMYPAVKNWIVEVLAN